MGHVLVCTLYPGTLHLAARVVQQEQAEGRRRESAVRDLQYSVWGIVLYFALEATKVACRLGFAAMFSVSTLSEALRLADAAALLVFLVLRLHLKLLHVVRTAGQRAQLQGRQQRLQPALSILAPGCLCRASMKLLSGP